MIRRLCGAAFATPALLFAPVEFGAISASSWLSILALIALFAPIDTLAAWLLVPYLAWVSFAAFLNFTVWRMNPDASPRNSAA